MIPKLVPIGLITKAKVLVVDNADTLLTGAAITGTVATAVLTGQASLKAARLIDAARLEAHDYDSEGKGDPEADLSKTQKVKLVGTLYLPAVGVGLTTITCIVVANRLSAKRVAALALASGISERALTEYKAKVVEKFTDRQNEAIRDEIAQERISKHPLGTQVIVTGDGEVLCYDMLTGRYFKSSVEEIKKAENKVNYEIIHFMSASLSSFFDEIGLPPTNYTDMVGWNMGNPLEVKFSTIMSDDNRPCLAIDFTRPPIMDYDKHWD
jgi:hypothetical protein